MEADPDYPLSRYPTAVQAVEDVEEAVDVVEAVEELVSDKPPGVPRHVVIVAGRDMANPAAGGSELLIDQLASGLVARGDRVTLLCGGPSAKRGYEVVRGGGNYSVYLRAPWTYARRIADCDLVVEVCNGLPFLTPFWARKPTLCLINHVHTELWSIRFPPPLSTVGRFLERRVMPWAHRRNLVIAVSGSTADGLTAIGVDRERIRMLYNGVEPPGEPAPRSAEPQFLAFGRLADYKRIDLLLRLWERVRPITGGRLIIAGDGPERSHLESIAGEGVTFTGRVSEEEKNRLMFSSWLLLHPALIEGWGIVVAEAAIRGTPTIGFDVPGLRDSVVDRETGLLNGTESAFASAWASLALDENRRAAMGEAARQRAMRLHWEGSVRSFISTIDEAIARTAEGGTR